MSPLDHTDFMNAPASHTLLHNENTVLCWSAKCPQRNTFQHSELRLKKRVNL